MPSHAHTHIERTFVMIKPEGVRRCLVGEIVRRLENRELKIRSMKMMTASRELVEKHYHTHANRSFFEEMLELMTSGPVVAMVWEGEHAIEMGRQMTGSVKPFEAAPGTIRGDYASSMLNSLIHVSDSPDTSAKEIALWFPEGIAG